MKLLADELKEMNLLVEKFQPADAAHQEAARNIIICSGLLGTMRPLSRETMAMHPYGLIAYDHGERYPRGVSGVGYVALVGYEEEVGTVGALVVYPRYHRRGIGAMLAGRLINSLVSEFPEMQSCYTFANDESKNLFLRLGGVLVGQREPISSTGCNYVIDLSPVVTP